MSSELVPFRQHFSTPLKKYIVYIHPIHSFCQAITPRLASPRTQAMGFPSLTKHATLEDGGAGVESGVDMGDRQLRNSRRGPRRSRESTRTARRYGAGNGTSACSSRGQRRRGERGGTLSDDQYGEGVSREGGRDRGVGRSRSGAPDDATSIWSGWHTTGIPSWDILVSEILGEASPFSMVSGQQHLDLIIFSDREKNVELSLSHRHSEGPEIRCAIYDAQLMNGTPLRIIIRTIHRNQPCDKRSGGEHEMPPARPLPTASSGITRKQRVRCTTPVPRAGRTATTT